MLLVAHTSQIIFMKIPKNIHYFLLRNAVWNNLNWYNSFIFYCLFNGNLCVGINWFFTCLLDWLTQSPRLSSSAGDIRDLKIIRSYEESSDGALGRKDMNRTPNKSPESAGNTCTSPRKAYSGQEDSSKRGSSPTKSNGWVRTSLIC